MKTLTIVAGAITGLLIFSASAQDKPAAAPAAAPAAPKTVALISAVGDQFTYLRQKTQTGSNMEPYIRRVVTVQNNGLDAIVLRGLERALLANDPTAKPVFMRLNPPEMEGVLPQDRDKAAITKLVALLEKMPERMNWDRIIVVTPAWQFSATGGMGTKIQGLGVYVQPLALDPGQSDFEVGGMDEFTTSAPDDRTKKTKSSTYVAPFSYTQTWILDAKTLKVLEKDTNKQSVKLYDKDSTAIDVQNQLTPDQLAVHIETFVERASARALGNLTPTVTIEEVKPGAAAPAKPK